MLLSSPRKRGCFRSGHRRHRLLNRLPRASGGVSERRAAVPRARRSSPRKRGCFRSSPSRRGFPAVFPAQAGVFLNQVFVSKPLIGLPRASGGVSSLPPEIRPCSRSSPRKRGCFPVWEYFLSIRSVFPAQAGVFPRRHGPHGSHPCLPRASGGVSSRMRSRRVGVKSSPRKRGCFCPTDGEDLVLRVFPAQAGVFLKRSFFMVSEACLPRASGGVSSISCCFSCIARSSPRKRGCFSLVRKFLPALGVFPAQAGVFLWPPMALSVMFCLPRASGGVSPTP